MASSLIADIHNGLAAYVEREDHAGALAYLREQFPSLPQEIQAEILTQAYVSALEEEVVRAPEIAQIQAECVVALRILKGAMEIAEENTSK